MIMAEVHSCELSECTIGTTLKCLKSYVEPKECPHYKTGIDFGSNDIPSNESTLNNGIKARLFPAGNEMGTEEANFIMRSRYAYLVAILGPTNSGKTCFLTSLYLHLSLGTIPQYLFAGSETLPGFEIRARGLRKWKNGALSDQLVPHTILQDPRNPSLMHLCITRTNDQEQEKIDLLLTDLPGEWSDTLINRAESANRFDFLKRSDGVIIIIDGPLLASNITRNVEIQKTVVLLGRLRNSVEIDSDVPIVFMVTKGDEINMSIPVGMKRIEERAIELGFNPITIMSIAFSRKPDQFSSGIGIFETLDVIISKKWPIKINKPLFSVENNHRSFTRYTNTAI
jgi:GTPase SAR1 family protein